MNIQSRRRWRNIQEYVADFSEDRNEHGVHLIAAEASLVRVGRMGGLCSGWLDGSLLYFLGLFADSRIFKIRERGGPTMGCHGF